MLGETINAIVVFGGFIYLLWSYDHKQQKKAEIRHCREEQAKRNRMDDIRIRSCITTERNIYKLRSEKKQPIRAVLGHFGTIDGYNFIFGGNN